MMIDSDIVYPVRLHLIVLVAYGRCLMVSEPLTGVVCPQEHGSVLSGHEEKVRLIE